PFHVVTGELEEAAQRVAVRGPPAITHVEGTGRVGRDELDLDLLARAPGVAPEGRVHGGVDEGAPPRGPEVEVEEARPRDLDALDVLRQGDGAGDLLRQLPGRTSCCPRQGKSDVRGPGTELAPRRPVEHDLVRKGKPQRPHRGAQGPGKGGFHFRACARRFSTFSTNSTGSKGLVT